MKKVQIHEFDPVIYPRKVWVCIGKCRDEIKNIFKCDNGKEIDFTGLDGARAGVYRVQHKENKLLGELVVCESKKELDVEVIAHEAYHVADDIVNDTGMDYVNGTGNEHIAFLVGWCADCINQVKTNRFKDAKTHTPTE